MLTFSELVKKANACKTETLIDVLENTEDVSYITIGDKLLSTVTTNIRLVKTTKKGWIKSVSRQLKNKKNIEPSKFNKIKKHIFSDNCSSSEYLLLGGNASKQLFTLLDKGLDFNTAINTHYKESENV